MLLLSLDCSAYPWSIPYNAVLNNEASSTIFWVFGMIQVGIEPWSLGPGCNGKIVAILNHVTIHSSRNLEMACLALMQEALMQRFHGVLVSIWRQWRGFEKSWKRLMVVTIVSNLTLIILIRKELPHLLISPNHDWQQSQHVN